MTRFLPHAVAVATLMALGACSTTVSAPPAELVQAREAVRTAERDPDVLADAPLELKRATDALAQADRLNADDKSLADISTAAYVAKREAQTALEVARAKRQQREMKDAQIDRERARAEQSAAEAEQARRVAMAARQQATVQGVRAAVAESRADSAQREALVAQGDAAQARASAEVARQEAAALQQQLAQVQAQATDRGMLVTLGDVLFEFNRAEVKPSARDELAKVAQFLKEHPERRILVEGFTDNVGSAEYNQELSRKRAESVAAALVALGVPADRVTTAGYGKDHPVADNATDTNRAMNRRVEVYISNDARPVQPRRG